jgi:hypothetical protein
MDCFINSKHIKNSLKNLIKPGMVVPTFNPRNLGGCSRRIGSSRTTSATQRNPVSKEKFLLMNFSLCFKMRCIEYGATGE